MNVQNLHECRENYIQLESRKWRQWFLVCGFHQGSLKNILHLQNNVLKTQKLATKIDWLRLAQALSDIPKYSSVSAAFQEFESGIPSHRPWVPFCCLSKGLCAQIGT
jgi:hypothetical protein